MNYLNEIIEILSQKDKLYFTPKKVLEYIEKERFKYLIGNPPYRSEK